MVRGITSDSYVIYEDTDAGSLFGISTLGGSPQFIAQAFPGQVVITDGQALLLWGGSPIASLIVWTAATGPHEVTQFSDLTVADVSPDGTHVVYSANADLTSVDVVVANIDGTGKSTLVTGVNNGFSTCYPSVGWAGVGAAAVPVVGYCPGTTTVATVSRFTGATWVKADILTNGFAPPSWSTDTAGTKLFTTVTGTRNAIVVPITGGAQTPIDTSVYTGFMSSDGASAIYWTTAQSIKRSPTVSPAPVTLVPASTMIIGVLWSSPDQSKWMYYTANDGVTGLTNLAMTTTASAPGILTTLSSANDTAVFGEPFTADSSRALFLTNVDPFTQLGTLRACASGGAPVTLGTNVHEHYTLTGTTVVYSPNTVFGSITVDSRADIVTSDVSLAVPTQKVLVRQAHTYFARTANKQKIVYSFEGTAPGIYVAAPPP